MAAAKKVETAGAADAGDGASPCDSQLPSGRAVQGTAQAVDRILSLLEDLDPENVARVMEEGARLMRRHMRVAALSGGPKRIPKVEPRQYVPVKKIAKEHGLNVKTVKARGVKNGVVFKNHFGEWVGDPDAFRKLRGRPFDKR